MATGDGSVGSWLATVDLIRQEERVTGHANTALAEPAVSSGNDTQTTVASKTSIQTGIPPRKPVNGAIADDGEDDLDIDLAKAALDTGTAAFEAGEWEESSALLQEALQVLHQLPVRQRGFCDVFAVQYRLAVCAYNIHEPADVEQALLSVVQQPVNSNEHRQHVCHAAHLLSLLYIRTGQIDRAKSEAERALHGRRRLLGKLSDASLESTALMGHIYVLLNNRPRAKACLAIIPEARREDMRKVVEASLATELERPESSLMLTSSVSKDSNLIIPPVSSSPWESAESLPRRPRYDGRVSSNEGQQQSLASGRSCQQSRTNGGESESLRSVTVTSLSSTEDISGSRSTEVLKVLEHRPSDIEAHRPSVSGVSERPKAYSIFGGTGLSRGEILRNLRCVPVDQIEEAVCNGDQVAVASLLKKKPGFLRSKVHKALHAKRVTALHFAALFGETEIARRLISSGFDVNEVPELSTTRLTPLKFAIGARQVEMVSLLVAKGAKPIEPDTWSTLAGQLMDRSWLTNTMSMAERDDLDQAPSRIMAILKIWLKHRWNINAPYDATGRTLLHQAVAFESGAYRWDSNLRITMTRFLCEHGADPLVRDSKGNTPYDMAVAVADQGLLTVLDQHSKHPELEERFSNLLELSAVPSSPIELPDNSTRPVKLSVWNYG